MSLTVGIMDSGVGGLSVLREIRKLLPEHHYIYYSDNANCPYGEKSPEFIHERCAEIVRGFQDEGACAVVLACNTATAAAINSLRREFSIPFIGTEPAIKPAVSRTRSGVVGVLATAVTLHSERYMKLRNAVPEGIRVVDHEGVGFVEAVEAGRLEGPETEAMVAASLQPLVDAGVDTVVLGCTHYPFLVGSMKKFAPQIEFIEPAPAIARRLKTVLAGLGDSAAGQRSAIEPGSVRLISSGDPEPLRRMFGIISP